MFLNILATFILLVAWIFGGALFFNNGHASYKNVVLGWSVLNAMVVGAVFFVSGIWWAIGRLFLTEG